MSEPRTVRSGWWGLLLLALWTALAAWWLKPPDPLPANAPAASFSAVRAMTVLDGLIGDVGPHPLGTPPARIVETRLVRHLRALGLHPEVTPRTLCTHNTCATVRNVVALIPGADRDADLIMLSAHYDSVRSGPGAGDDGAGVASALEITRILRHLGPQERGVLLVLNEGEELGLLGAQAFVEQSPWAGRVGAVVNLEARGTGGPSYLFEIAGSTRTIVQNYARWATAPAVSSTYIAIYDLLPNNTDVSVFAQHDIPAANLAFLGNGRWYHTPLDDLAHLDPASVQHHGEQGLGLVRALAAADLPETAPANDVAFDVMGLFILRWPEAWAIPLAVLAALMGLGGVLGLFLRRWMSPWRLLGAVALVLGWTAACVAAAWGIDLGLTALGASWHAVPLPFLVGVWATVLALTFAAGMIARRLGRKATWGALILVQGTVAIALATLLPGASYLGLIPALGLAFPLAGRALRADRRTQDVLDAVATVPSLFALQLALALQTAVGLSGIAVAAPLVLGLWPLLPWLGDGKTYRQGPGWAGTVAALGVAAVSFALAAFMPAATATAPQAMEVEAWDDGTATRWRAESRGWPRPAGLPEPWSAEGDIRASGVLPTTGEGHARIQVRSEGDNLLATIGAGPTIDEVIIQLRGPVSAASVEGQPVDPDRAITFLGGIPGGLTLALKPAGPGPIDARIMEGETAVPAGLPPLPEHWVPIHNGFRHYRASTRPIRP